MEIIIKGKKQEGKTTLAALLRKLLVKNGAIVSLKDFSTEEEISELVKHNGFSFFKDKNILIRTKSRQ